MYSISKHNSKVEQDKLDKTQRGSIANVIPPQQHHNHICVCSWEMINIVKFSVVCLFKPPCLSLETPHRTMSLSCFNTTYLTFDKDGLQLKRLSHLHKSCPTYPSCMHKC